jgi:hypothetical protein
MQTSNVIDLTILLTCLITFSICKCITMITQETNGNRVSFCHASFQFIYTSLFFVQDNKLHFDCSAMVNTRIDTTIQLTVLFSYTLYDTLKNKHKLDMIVHHIIVMICSIIGLNLNSHQLIGMFIMLNESSTPFLNLMKMNMCKPCSEILFVVTFLIFRIFLLPVLIVILWPCVDNWTTFIIFAIVCSLFCLNMHWARLIYFQCRKRCRKRCKNHKE